MDLFASFDFKPPTTNTILVISKAFSDFPLDIILTISSPFLLRIITKDEEIAVKTVDAAAAATETEIETEPEPAPANKTRADRSQTVRRSDISLMIEVRYDIKPLWESSPYLAV